MIILISFDKRIFEENDEIHPQIETENDNINNIPTRNVIQNEDKVYVVYCYYPIHQYTLEELLNVNIFLTRILFYLVKK